MAFNGYVTKIGAYGVYLKYSALTSKSQKKFYFGFWNFFLVRKKSDWVFGLQSLVGVTEWFFSE